MNIIDTYEECFNPFQLPHLFLKHLCHLYSVLSGLLAI